MITASELRIGNFVYERRCDGKLYANKVTEIKHFDTIDKIKCNSWFVDSPIEITKEWLLKFGFEFIVDTWYLKVFALWETEWGDAKGNTGIGFFYELRQFGMMDRRIEYVHQLQNLYFALTGEELILKSE